MVNKSSSSRSSQPVIYASNHQSTWEVFAFPFLIDNASAIIKKEMMYFPIIGLFFKKFMMIPVNRFGVKSGSWLQYAQNAFGKNRSIFIFPEGTRVAVDGKVSYKSGVYRLYEKLNCPVVPVALNSGYFWSRRSFKKYPGTVQVKFLDPIMPGLNSSEFMSLLQERIEKGRSELTSQNQFIKNTGGNGKL
jgi:1-acyl-sn-glycerol-3-phosphate acyltransferase